MKVMGLKKNVRIYFSLIKREQKEKKVCFTARLLHSVLGPICPPQSFEFMTLDLCILGK